MTPNIIRRKLAEKIYNSPAWLDKLDDTEPGHYGLQDWSVELSEDDLAVNIGKRTFYFEHAQFCFDVMLMSSNPEDGSLCGFSRDAKGSGTFDFSHDGMDVLIEDLNIYVNLDLFSEALD